MDHISLCDEGAEILLSVNIAGCLPPPPVPPLDSQLELRY